jgi:hypothetical protein
MLSNSVQNMFSDCIWDMFREIVSGDGGLEVHPDYFSLQVKFIGL